MVGFLICPCIGNAGILFARYLDSHPHLVCNKRSVVLWWFILVSVLEFGCGAALPSMIAAIRNAAFVLITEYPEKALLDNLASNIHANFNLFPSVRDRISIQVAWNDFCKSLLTSRGFYGDQIRRCWMNCLKTTVNLMWLYCATWSSTIRNIITF